MQLSPYDLRRLLLNLRSRLLSFFLNFFFRIVPVLLIIIILIIICLVFVRDFEFYNIWIDYPIAIVPWVVIILRKNRDIVDDSKSSL